MDVFRFKTRSAGRLAGSAGWAPQQRLITDPVSTLAADLGDLELLWQEAVPSVCNTLMNAALQDYRPWAALQGLTTERSAAALGTCLRSQEPCSGSLTPSSNLGAEDKWSGRDCQVH